ncbi:MAG: hypothetical protein KIT58_16005 [Planctomycetota bacterium]|nr:hypothetical protein [Planctomycetota bacterium]
MMLKLSRILNPQDELRGTTKGEAHKRGVNGFSDFVFTFDVDRAAANGVARDP